MLELDALPGLHDMVRNTWFEPAFPKGCWTSLFTAGFGQPILNSTPFLTGFTKKDAKAPFRFLLPF
jgi:hypothetical protein